MQKSIYQFFFFIHSLSIDIAIGACAMFYAIHRLLFNNLIPIPSHQYLLLFFATLCVYYTDHIQDSNNVLLVQPGKRHKLFKQYKKVFVTVIVLMVLLCAYLSIKYLLPGQIIGGLVLCIAMYIYLMKHRSFKRKVILEKEILICVLYTLSVFYFPFSTAISRVSSLTILLRPDQVLFFLLLFLIVLLTTMQNLFSVAIIERDDDSKGNIRSITSLFGSDRLRRLQLLMLLLQVVSSLLLLLLNNAFHLTAFVNVMAVIALINYFLPIVFVEPKNSIYRILGDACFIIAFLV